MSTYREALEQLEALTTMDDRNSISLRSGERGRGEGRHLHHFQDSHQAPSPRRLFALPTPTEPAQEAP